jgi:D-alanyl-D-alanine carboxypeptidase
MAAKSNDNKKLTETVSLLVREGLKLGSPGVVVSAIDVYGTSASAAAGLSSLRDHSPMTTHYRFAIGSITKTIVAVVVHQLVDEGHLSLNATGNDYLDEEILAGIANAREATLHTMMNHTSGIPSWEFDPDWIRRGRGDRFDPTRSFGKLDTLTYIRDRQPATGPVGKRYSYSNTNHTLLGLIIERVTGNDFATEVRRRVFESIGVTSFALESFEQIPEGAMAGAHHLATPFFRQTAGISSAFPEVSPDIIDTSAADLSPEWAAGGYVATMEDLATYGRALATDAYGMKVGRSLRAFESFEGPLHLPKPRRVGLGLFEIQTPVGAVAVHFGGTLGYCAAMMFPPDKPGPILTVGFNLGRMHTAAEDEHNIWQRWVLDEAFPAIVNAD